MTLDVRDGLERARRAIAPPEDAFERLERRREWRVRRRRVGSAVVALAVAGVAMGGALFALRTTAQSHHGRDLPGSGPTAPSGAPLVAGPGQFYYDRSVQTYSSGQQGSTMLFTRLVTERWWRPDGAGRERTTSTPWFATDADRQAWIDQNGPVEPHVSDRSFDPGTYPVDTDLSGLSTDPTVLAQQLADRTAPDGASPEPYQTPTPGVAGSVGAQLTAALNILQMPNATPALRSAVVDVAGSLDGVSRVDSATDPVGRAAFELRFPGEGGGYGMFVDPATNQPLAWGLLNDQGPNFAEVVTAAGVVDDTTQTAEGGGYLPAPVRSPEAALPSS
jgi:hypothetical protein